jgi:hypothetical protein
MTAIAASTQAHHTQKPHRHKLYAERNKSGEFTDIQTYKRAHGSDVKRGSKAETPARKKAGKSARKTKAK